MGRRFLTVAILVVCGAVQVCAQPSQKPPGPLGEILAPHRHSRPAPANGPRVADVPLDATNLGAPLVLDKNWRVGVTADPAAESPNFDDSTWDVRDAKGVIADVPDEDHPAGSPASEPMDAPDNLPAGHKRPFAWFRHPSRRVPVVRAGIGNGSIPVCQS